jgi:hypothetical protein
MKIQKFNESKKSKKEKITEIKSKINDFKEEFEVIDIPILDWKEIEYDTLKRFKNIIEKIGGHFNYCPACEGSDSYVFIVSKKPISKSKMEEYDKLVEELDEIN